LLDASLIAEMIVVLDKNLIQERVKRSGEFV